MAPGTEPSGELERSTEVARSATVAAEPSGDVPRFDGVDIRARGITARGARGCAFASVSLDVPAGSLAVVAGPGGSGRTSLLLALAGRLRILAGNIAVGKHHIPGDASGVRALVAVARAAPAVDLDDELLVDDLLRERAVIGGADYDDGVRAELFDLLGVDAPHGSVVGALPAYQRSMLAVALAAAERPGAVFLDDAVHGCAARESEWVWEGLRVLAARGCTVLATTTVVPALCDEDPSIPLLELPHPTRRDRIPVIEE